ncbi:hypothetical protein EVAR_60825_1 [Eumeta japonica]|uniref:RNA-directed DNA polymerase from transposon X-element n=1 Tax=Eumeta variegata TaxID=151549 RepID=A0A4C1ZZ58_EUMVA|nr:hypothetical protein EVAR_60825_1 [Eumeta japonica]
MRNGQGKCTRKIIEILNKATEYYENLYQSKLNKPITSATNDIQDSKPVPLVLKKETERAIVTQKSGKAPGPDNITNELLRVSMPMIVPKLTNLFNEIIKTESVPRGLDKVNNILIAQERRQRRYWQLQADKLDV